MNILKHRITRIIAFFTAAYLIAFSCSGIACVTADYNLISNRADNSDDNLDSWEHLEKVADLYTDLWLIGSVYLKNTDKNGKYICSDARMSSVRKGLELRGLMDSRGEIIVPNKAGYEYYMSYQGTVISNTDKKPDEFSNMYCRKFENVYGDVPIFSYDGRIGRWFECTQYDNSCGMNYFYANQKAIALYDYDTSKLEYYIDELGAYIYKNKDGTLPVPWQEKTSEKIDVNYVTDAGISIYICPSAEMIEKYEKFIVEVENAENNYTKRTVEYLVFVIIAAMLTVYVFIMCGYSVKSRCVVMNGIYKLWTEIACIGVIATFVLASFLINEHTNIVYDIEELVRMYVDSDINLMNRVCIGVICALNYIFFATFVNIIIVKLKCRQFLKSSFAVSFVGNRFTEVYGDIKKKINDNNIIKDNVFVRRFILRIAVVICSMVFAFFVAKMTHQLWFGVFIAVAVFTAYIINTIKELEDITKLSEHISAINKGDYTRRETNIESAVYGMHEKLNNISDGIQGAVDAKLVSERMKIELVTNVSHDLKTPLTSIIGYINLLSMEELSPEARDYVTILEEKSERLKTMVSDVFDLAKATSKTDINFEKIDAVILTGQVIGDMQDRIEESGREVRTNIYEGNLPVYADGAKIYRVVQNIIDNALKYSLEKTRTYVTVTYEEGNAVIRVKNISSYEMNFDPKEITERFTRADESRTTEGNGLGLSIAKNFTEACGGVFEIKLDGDMFIAEVKLPVIETVTVNDEKNNVYEMI